MEFNKENLSDYRSLFKGREDVFAIRWEKSKKSGYMPAYFFDPYIYKLHVIAGGTFKTFNDKSYQPFTDNELIKHLTGKQQIGIYPLLNDNTSWFIAADFDEDNWLDSCKILINECNKENIPAYLERSRSGNGGHVWIFFDQPYPAYKSRKIVLHLLKQSGIISAFENESGFDRLFPNQDYHSGKGLGNLIALPLYQTAMEKGNSCFWDCETSIAYPDQWEYLKSIRKTSTKLLEDLFKSLSTEDSIVSSPDQDLTIRLTNQIKIQKQLIPFPLKSFLKDELSFANSEYFIKKNAGRNTFKTKMYFKAFEETDTEISIPRGFVGKLIRFCNQQKINFQFEDLRELKTPVNFEFTATLNEFQKPVIEAVLKKTLELLLHHPVQAKQLWLCIQSI